MISGWNRSLVALSLTACATPGGAPPGNSQVGPGVATASVPEHGPLKCPLGMNEKRSAITKSSCDAGLKIDFAFERDNNGKFTGACVTDGATTLECTFPDCKGTWKVGRDLVTCENGPAAAALAVSPILADNATFGTAVQTRTKALRDNSGYAHDDWIDTAEITITPKSPKSALVVSVVSTISAGSPPSNPDPHTAGWARIISGETTVAGTDIHYGAGRGQGITVPLSLQGVFVPPTSGQVIFKLQIKPRGGSIVRMINTPGSPGVGPGPGLMTVTELPFTEQ